MRDTDSRAKETSTTAASDEELVSRAQAGDTNAFSELLRRHTAKVYGLARYLCHGHAENAQDSFQNALLNAYRYLATFRREAQFSSWLTRIVINECLLHQRRQHKERDWVRLDEEPGAEESLSFEPADPFADPEEEYARQEFQATYQRCLAGLSDSVRDALILQVIDGFSINEIATRLGLSPSVVKTRIFRARRRLQRCLAKKFCRGEQCYWPGTKGVSA